MLASAYFLRESPEMPADPLSEILELTHARAVLGGGFSAGEPWAIRFPPRDTVRFSAILEGACWIRFDGEPEAARLEAGDVGLLTANRSYVMASDLDVPPVDALSQFRDGRLSVTFGSGQDFRLMAGQLLLDPASGRLLSGVLPDWLHIGGASPQAAPFRWLLNQLVEESGSDLPGAQLATGYLTQLLFTQVLRAHLKNADAMPAGWLRALADPRTGPALRLIHADPGRDWRLEDLARACAMSRTSFAARFRDVAGQPPLAYLTGWRMRLAARALREEATPVAVIGQSLGYASESAFSNAFKRVVGMSPRAWRTGRRQAAGDQLR